MPDKFALLKRHWGYDSFRPLQEEVVDCALAGTDVLALFPTGGGKSLCYQLPALMLEGVCLVVSPLIALMKDQVQRLNERHLKAACIVSGMSRSEVATVLTNCLCGEVKYLYVSPERLRQRMFIEHFRQMKVCLIAVDEAHCVSQWGYDFRPPYLQIADVRAYHPQVPLMALTATATAEVEADIQKHLHMRGGRVVRASFARANLSYNVVHDENKTARLLRIVNRMGGCGIVYARNRRLTQEVAQLLENEGITASYYHAGLDAAERDRRQAAWMAGKSRVMVATNAFGMGIDKSDVRFVVHLDMPDSLEAYFQEAGRAGRDGQPAYAVALYGNNDTVRLQREFQIDYPPLEYVRGVYKALCNHYRLPMGSGADSRYDFEMEAICNEYNFSVREFYSACQLLEREGLIEVPEREDLRSTVFIPLQRDELYRFRVEHRRYGDLLEVLIRMYPGIFMSAVAVEEKKVAARSLWTAGEVAKMLLELHGMHVLEYRAGTNKPQVIFPTGRVSDRDIHLGGSSYADLKTAAAQRLAAVQRYVEEEGVCRSRQLLAYFGQTKGVADCGCCDVCRRRKSRTPEALRAEVLKLLAHRSIGMHELRALLENEGYVEVVETLRDMIDEGVVYLDENLLLRTS